MNIGIIIASVRDQRVGKDIAQWVFDYAKKRDDKTRYELVDLKDYDLPLLGMKPKEGQGEAIKRWKDKMNSLDGYIYVTPEYNRVLPGAFKNALDYLLVEVQNKAVGFVGYGGLGGLSAIQSLRMISAEQSLASVSAMVNLSVIVDFDKEGNFKPNPYHGKDVELLLEQVNAWSKALKTMR